MTALTIISPTTADPASVLPGETVTITYQITVNRLDQVVDRQVSILTAPETTVNPAVIPQPLSASTFTVSTNVTVPSGTAPGTYDVRVRARQPATGGWNVEVTNSRAVIVREADALTVDVIFYQTGVDTDFTGTVLTVDGVNYGAAATAAGVTVTKAAGESISFEYHSPLVVGGKRYVWTSTSGLSSAQSGTITVASGGGSVTGSYQTQYYLTVNSAHGTPGGEGWYNSGATAYATITPLTVDGPTGMQYVFAGWSGHATGSGSPSDGITMDGPKTAIATWTTQYYLTVNTNPAEVLTLDPSAMSGEGWYDEGETATVDAVQLVDKVAGESRYDFRSWTGATPTGTGNQAGVVMDSAKTATANYQLQYQLTLAANPTGTGTQTGEGWYDAGTNANISTTNPVGSYYFSGWSTTDMPEISSQYALSTTVLMDKAKTVTANYIRMKMPTTGKTLGFWSNKNGQSYIGADDLNMLRGLNLVNAKGLDFDPTTYDQFKTWLLKADAVYMGYMLSAQLSATELTVYNGLVSGLAQVWVDDGDLIVEPGEVLAIQQIMVTANGLTKSTDRAAQEYNKDLLDKINNNKLPFVDL